MPTRLYFHNANNTNTGTFNQGQVYSTAQYGIAYGNGLYVRGNLTNIQKSTNAIDWSDPIATPAATNIYGITFGNGYFMICSSKGAVFRSTDATTWTQVRTAEAGTPVVQNFVYAGSYWFLCFDGATLSVATGDGTSWTTGDLGNFGASGIYTFAGYNPTTGEYAVSGSGTTAGRIIKTTNPVGAWTAVTIPSANPGTIGVIGWNAGNSIWIIGSGTLSNSSNIFTTPTLSATPTWTAQTVGGAAVARNWWMINFGSITVTGGTQLITSSSNGTSWFNHNATGLTPAMNGQTWYTGTHDGTYFYLLSAVGVLMRSTDGANWTRIGGPLSNTVEFISLTPLATPPATAYKLKSMNTTIGTSQASLATTTWAGTSAAQNNFIGFFCSEPLKGAQTVGGGTMILNGADLEANLASNWWMNGLCVYVWRPSTGTIVGYVRDYQGTPIGGTEATAASSQQVTNITGITSSAVSAQDQDVIICEIWVTATQGMATAYTNSFFYDGTTVNTTENAVVTSQASFIEFTENLVFGASSGNTGNMFMLF